MWPQTFEERLQEWHALRSSLGSTLDHDNLLAINRWWFRAPIINQTLHVTAIETWPDPWSLLSQSGYCDLARSLGMIYTVAITYPTQRDRLVLYHTNQGNLVVVDRGAYILNWYPTSIDDVCLDEFDLILQVPCSKMYKLLD